LPTESDTVNTINGTVVGDVERVVFKHVFVYNLPAAAVSMSAAMAAMMRARHRIEIHIVKFTNHDKFLQRIECVNNIWLEANQCLTARVDA